MSRNIAVYGIYLSQQNAEDAVLALKNSDYLSADISVLFSEKAETKDLTSGRRSKLHEIGSAGAGTEENTGGALGLLAGFGAVLGGISGALAAMNIPENEVKKYEGRIQEGGIFLSVRCDNYDRMKQILKKTGTVD